MTKIEEIFDIQRNDIISITGSGGKTSLITYLALSLSKKGRVLMTTSTKIALPKDPTYTTYTSFDSYVSDKSERIVCLGEEVSGKAKLKSIGYDNLKEVLDDFDYVLIEADGCRNLPLKFWYDYEPVIYDFTTKVIGVFPIKIIGRELKEGFTYNYEGFSKNIGTGIIDSKMIRRLIAYDKGFYKGCDGEKYIFLNQVESEKDFANVRKIREDFDFTDIKLSYGSIKEGKFYEN
ncbi:selenium cofactor biosynthesis protein YqeC [uncultured Anaerococcus sp.]|uniref:selenium cofactor biosynthesis protein YqeC n=1 Tax=uncultured Anaerococcus sp. TaxID=293428 RepID=UPI0028058497|nr:selenium cofactor biosynthesis protein YqeC [uncultured Anaerococcus sp.]